MRPRVLRWSFLGAFALGALAACGESQEWKDVKKETGEAWAAAKAWGVAQRGEAEKVFASSVDDLSRSYEKAKARAQAAGGDAAKTLDSQWGDVQQRLASLKSASAEKWEQARDGFVKAYEAFKAEVSKP